MIWELISDNLGIIGSIIAIFGVLLGFMKYFWNLHTKMREFEKKTSHIDKIDGRLRDLETENAGNTASLNIILNNPELLKNRKGIRSR